MYRRLLLLVSPLLCLLCPGHLVLLGIVGLGYTTHTEHWDDVAILLGVVTFMIWSYLEYRHHRKHRCNHRH